MKNLSLAKTLVPTPVTEIGDIVTHKDGRTVKIVSGQYWGKNGVSNFWNWREVLDDGSLGKLEAGYGKELNMAFAN